MKIIAYNGFIGVRWNSTPSYSAASSVWCYEGKVVYWSEGCAEEVRL